MQVYQSILGFQRSPYANIHLIQTSNKICFQINLVPQLKGCEDGEQLNKKGNAEEDSNQGYETPENEEKFVEKNPEQ